ARGSAGITKIHGQRRTDEATTRQLQAKRAFGTAFEQARLALGKGDGDFGRFVVENRNGGGAPSDTVIGAAGDGENNRLGQFRGRVVHNLHGNIRGSSAR